MSLPFLHSSLFLFSSFILFLEFSSFSRAELGLQCSDHPAGGAPTNGVLIRSWENLDVKTRPVSKAPVYEARFDKFPYTAMTSKNGSGQKSYSGMDMFFIRGNSRGKKVVNLVRMHFQRPALVYMMLELTFAASKGIPIASLPGWNSEGVAVLSGTSNVYQYGIFQNNTMPFPPHVYVFSKPTTGNLNEIVLPQWKWIKSNVKGLQTKQGLFHLRISEADGSPSSIPTLFNGVKILPNMQCPKSLHDAWGVENDDVTDTTTKGQLFGSWHPPWDPCFWW